MFTHFRISMNLVDERTLQIIRASAPDGFARITIAEISEQVGCHWNTAQRATSRLVAAGCIRKQSNGRGGCIFEVLNER